MLGQQFLPDGTGIAYFDDGTTESFNHTFTPEKGYYYDNSTVFVYGQPPGHESNQTIWDMHLQSTELGATGDIINVTISDGAEILGDRAIQPSNIIKAKVGDVLVWTNEDWQAHNIMSPPEDYQSQTEAGGNWQFLLQPGQNNTLVLTRPIGMHFADIYNPEINGAVIVEERQSKWVQQKQILKQLETEGETFKTAFATTDTIMLDVNEIDRLKLMAHLKQSWIEIINKLLDAHQCNNNSS